MIILRTYTKRRNKIFILKKYKRKSYAFCLSLCYYFPCCGTIYLND